MIAGSCPGNADTVIRRRCAPAGSRQRRDRFRRCRARSGETGCHSDRSV